MTVEIYTTRTCPYCTHAKQLLQQNGITYTEIPVGGDAAKLVEMVHRSGNRTVPQIFFNDQPVGGYDQLKSLLDGEQAA